MKSEQMTEALEAAAGQVGVKVRYETMTGDTAGGGGLCRIRGEWHVIIDRRATTSERTAILAQALVGFDLESVYLAPEVRRAIDAHRDEPRPAASSERRVGRRAPADGSGGRS